jgi:gamma-glutamyltranspeptidase/glutathione hydrolase
MIALVEHLGLPLTHNSSEYVDLLARIMQVVFHDQRFVKTWRPEVSPTWDTYLSRHHIAALAADVQARRRTRATSSASGTTHVTTCDDQGNAVSMTHSIGSIAGAGVMTPGLGFFYNNFLGHLNPSPGSPDSIYPGARIGSLCPAIWTHGGSLRLAWGSPGGSRLTTSALQTLLNHVWLGFPIQTAVLLPRFHAEEQHVIHIEPPFEAAARQALHGLGYRLVDSTLAGVVQAIAFGGGTPIPGADARGGMGVAVA